jgi:serine/threonine protein phosphatase PrpC
LITAMVHYASAAATNRGRKRSTNEDAFGYSVEHGVYVVCDGMGGAAAGEIASSLAVDEMMRLMNTPLGLPVKDAALQAIQAANAAIYSRSRRSARLSGMGTTLVSLVTEESRAWVLNVGDSRCYRLRGNLLEQITLDHSLVEEQVRLGRMTPDEALHSPLRNVITRALGTQNEVTADVFEMETEPGDVFLLCSDGLTREVDDRRLEEILAGGQPLDEVCESLVCTANKAGGRDNITCVVVRTEA